ncbi:MAG: hypothetical protein M1836_002608 [Candelina mexicana]|nr:MAG: hypothetical protein M1836_002608 [Candelina mexicana]
MPPKRPNSPTSIAISPKHPRTTSPSSVNLSPIGPTSTNPDPDPRISPDIRPDFNYSLTERIEILPLSTLPPFLLRAATIHNDVCIWLTIGHADHQADGAPLSPSSPEKVIVIRTLIANPTAIDQCRDNGSLQDRIAELPDAMVESLIVQVSDQHREIKQELRVLVREREREKVDFERLFVEPWTDFWKASQDSSNEETELQSSTDRAML